jgi:multiple sugar transport system substrate-binding protein
MNTTRIRPIFILMLWMVVFGIMAACGPTGGPQQPQVIERTVVVTQVVEVMATAEPPLPTGSAARAVEAARQYAGTTLNVTWEAGLQAQDPLLFSGPEWEKLTGIQINVVEIPFTELFSQAVAEHLAGSGAFDVINYTPAWIGDLADAGVLEPLDPFIDKYMDKSDLEDIHPTYRGLTGWKGQTYGLFDDGDVFVMYYRKDLFEDEQNQADFQARFGRELVPPATWQEWDEVCQFFTEKFAPDLHGCAIQRAEGANFFWFEDHFRVNGGRFFDDEMNAAINSNMGVQTLTEMVNSNQWMPPGVEKWGFIEVLSAWLDGKLGMIITWPPIGRWSEGYGTQTAQLSWVPKTQIAGHVGYAVPPGGHAQLAAGFNLGVSADSKNKEAAYLFIQWLNSPEISGQRVKLPFALRDPFRLTHFEDTLYQNLWPNAPAYLNTLQDGAATGLTDLAIPGAREYEEALDRAVTAAYAGTDPKAALDRAAAEWDEITQRIGVDSQKAAYQDWVSSRAANAYP